MNYGQSAKDLILEIKRSDWLPPYNEEGVRSSLSEISLHFEELEAQMIASNNAAQTMTSAGSGEAQAQTGDSTANSLNVNARRTPRMESRPSMLLHDTAIRRIKRCLLAYHSYRIDKLKALRWETSATLPPHVRSLLSEAEVDFYLEYDKLLSRYPISLSSTGADGIDANGAILDLNADRQPPEEDMVEVRVVKDGLGTIVTEHWGEVSLELGTTHYLSRGDVEHLIRQGVLQQLDAEETF
mmetsp:Transcript_14649/g.20905  ORF Transcript_14649/g.20905 Transcript_14649/m.20905 type:complete len:241 (-) Transcript_14649:173-895(-)|eukprot:CAMPEP_0184863390 /NCGR_PEP_ID=MMETSP0580-20130426/10878_1 /TAXON_ID=1118495 /ORGANISM="Dactyliosolen fragilissimus" /LENGTH=240 /DNA_ID=CAMNT_0027361697 /DNA_START=41 /DNA_END=763 /DNA_ORIENTATION=-